CAGDRAAYGTRQRTSRKRRDLIQINTGIARDGKNAVESGANPLSIEIRRPEGHVSARNLSYLFRPQSIAMIGASERAGSVGATVYRNLLGGGFTGPVYAVNPGHATVAGHRAYR